MKKSRLLWLGVLLAALAGCCSHPVEVASLKDVEVKQDKYFGKYLKYVDSDVSLTPAQKNDERATAGAIHRQTVAVRKSLEGEK